MQISVAGRGLAGSRRRTCTAGSTARPARSSSRTPAAWFGDPVKERQNPPVEVIRYRGPVEKPKPAPHPKAASEARTVAALEAGWLELARFFASLPRAPTSSAQRHIKQQLEAYQALAELDRLDPGGTARRRSQEAAVIEACAAASSRRLAAADRVISIPELEHRVGEEVAVSPWVEISQERIDTFAKAIDDPQWIHVDRERARARLRHHHRARLPHAVAALAPLRAHVFLRRSQDGGELRPEPRALHRAGAERLAGARASRSTSSSGSPTAASR